MKLHTHLPVSITASLSTKSVCTKADFTKLPLTFFPDKYFVCALTQMKKTHILLQCLRSIMQKGHLKTFTPPIYTHPERLVATKSLSEDNCFQLLQYTQLMDYKDSNSLFYCLVHIYIPTSQSASNSFQRMTEIY